MTSSQSSDGPQHDASQWVDRLPKGWVACLAICFVSASMIFLLPLAIPVSFFPAISASYIAGFNNRAAAIATAVISTAVLIGSWKLDSQAPARTEDPEVVTGRVGPLLTGATIALTCAFSAGCGWMLFRSHLRYIADAGYFIEQMSAHAESGRPLYSGLEFAYGPVLFYPTIWLQRGLHCGWLMAYFMTLAFEQSLGLLQLAYLLNRFQIKPQDRRFGFVLLAAGALNPLLGLNYTLFRFLTPFFLLVFASGLRSGPLSALLLILGEAFCLGISAEMGVAFAAGVFVLGLVRGLLQGWRWSYLCITPVLGATGFSLLVGSSYLLTPRSFLKGALNLPVAPYPHILIYLFAVVWLVPCYLGLEMRRSSAAGTTMLPCYAAGIGLLPATLGRCDPLHVFFYGAGLVVTSLAAIRSRPRGVRMAWISALIVFVFWEQGITNRMFQFRTADTLSVDVMPLLSDAVQDAVLKLVGSDSDLAAHLRAGSADEEYQLDVARLERTVGNADVATPLETTPTVEASLKDSHHYKSDYYAFTMNVFDSSSEARKIEELNQAEWALIPIGYTSPFNEVPGNLGDLQGFAFPYRTRHVIPFQAGKAFKANLVRWWHPVDTLGPYTLLRNDNRRVGTRRPYLLTGSSK